MSRLTTTSVAISLILLGISLNYTYQSVSDNSVLLLGIVHPSVQNYYQPKFNFSVTFKSFPWKLHNATISDYVSSSYNLLKMLWSTSYKKTSVYDARGYNNLSFDESGFMLIKINNIFDDLKYNAFIINVSKQLFPTAIKIEILSTVIRGNGDNNPVPFMHYDIVPERKYAAQLYPQYEDILISNDTNYWIIGTWTPIHMNSSVCTDSLALLDASTTSKQDYVISDEDYTAKYSDGTLHRKQGKVASISRNESHKFYYYSNMTMDEMIIFTHFRSNELIKQNLHGSFTPNYCNKNHEKRQSIESKILIQFKSNNCQ